jgi:hypothetical protein
MVVLGNNTNVTVTNYPVIYFTCFWVKFNQHVYAWYSMAGVTSGNVEYLAKAIHEVTKAA